MIPFYESLAIIINDMSITNVIYFDFAKASYSVNHDIILHKLKYQFNIDGVLLKFLVNYLNDRKQSVVIGGSSSSVLPVISGIPQAPFLDLYFLSFLSIIYPGTNIFMHMIQKSRGELIVMKIKSFLSIIYRILLIQVQT